MTRNEPDNAHKPPGTAPRRPRGAATVICTAAVASCALASERSVTITGGADVSGHNFTWEVTNNSDVPIVYLRFPENHSDAFAPPEGWKRRRLPPSGWLWFRRSAAYETWCDRDADGIRPRQSKTFRMRIRRQGTLRGAGTVHVRFADGTEVAVDGVEVPRAASAGETYASLLAFAAIFGLILLVRGRRRRIGHEASEPT